ncbi:unnamed protein product [Cuscuta europaea]|uniref:Uncharacterized protein n=1 Tax=Cuscuta europaea TaxID=41803 RepID=A0A9P0YTN5_CUSEU|nr:unnamed protein product [Cuscuta europaea]
MTLFWSTNFSSLIWRQNLLPSSLSRAHRSPRLAGGNKAADPVNVNVEVRVSTPQKRIFDSESYTPYMLISPVGGYVSTKVEASPIAQAQIFGGPKKQ